MQNDEYTGAQREEEKEMNEKEKPMMVKEGCSQLFTTGNVLYVVILLCMYND